MIPNDEKDEKNPSTDELQQAYERGIKGKASVFEQTTEEEQKELEGKRERAKDDQAQDDED
jgi:hypothetical protein